MKKIYLLSLSVLAVVSSKAQIEVEDSVILGAATTNTVFYKLSNGTKTSAVFNDWHLAFATVYSDHNANAYKGTTIRMNEAFGTKVYRVPNLTAASFNTLIDTANYKTWPQLHDSDTSFYYGAFNNSRDITKVYDMGWGTYSPGAQFVTGDSIFLVELPNNGGLKKLLINTLKEQNPVYEFDVQWANVTDSSNNIIDYKVSKTPYTSKNLVYLDLLGNGTLYDKEPASNSWDLQFLKYAATDVQGAPFYPSVGAWSNKGVCVAEVKGQPTTITNYSTYPCSSELNVIGRDWKEYNQGAATWTIHDSLVYFVTTTNQEVYKLVFTDYSGSSTGVIKFKKTRLLTSPTALNDLSEQTTAILNAYPNPTTDQLSVILNNEKEGAWKISVHDISGRLVKNFDSYISSGTRNVSVYTGDLESGNYLLHFQSEGQTLRTKFVVSK